MGRECGAADEAMQAEESLPGQLDGEPLQIALAPSADSPRRARRFVRRAVQGWGCAQIGDAVVMLTNELVTNAVLHAGSRVVLRLRHVGDGIRVEVADADPRRPDPQPYEVDAQTGRGMALLTAEASAWGVEPAEGGKVVWFEVAL
ncbi:MAG: ATP-binding protein [Egibacteraceae bacterium]